MSGKIDDKPQLAESSKEVGDESSWKMKSLPEQMKVMEKKTYPGLKLPRSDTDILKETLIRLEEQEEEMNEKADQNLQILRSKIDQLKESLNKLKGQSKVAGETYDDERAEELKAELNQLTEQRKKMYERTHHESISLRSVMNTLKESLNEMEEQREKMDKKTSKISRSETDILEETLNRLIKQKEQIYEKTSYGSQFLRREIDRLEGRRRFILVGYIDERAEDKAELNQLKEQRKKMYERTRRESKILRPVIDTLKESLIKLKGQIKKWNVWTDDESKWSGVDDALKFMDERVKMVDDELKWRFVDRAFRNMELHLPRRRFLYEPMLMEKPHTSRFDGGSSIEHKHTSCADASTSTEDLLPESNELLDEAGSSTSADRIVTTTGDATGGSSIEHKHTSCADASTSTEDLLPGTNELLDEAGSSTSADRIVTTTGDATDGINVSKSIRRLIPLEGVQVNVGGCSVTFPPRSFHKSTRIGLKAEINPSKWPKNFEGYTPTLYLDAEGLLCKVHVRLPSWRVSDHSKNMEATVLHGLDEQGGWEDTNSMVPFTSEPYFEFDWGDFSPIVLGGWFSTPDFLISGKIFVSEKAEIGIAFHVDTSMAFEAISDYMRSMQPSKHFKIGLNQFRAKVDEKIETYITCMTPKKLKFLPPEPFTFTVDKDFGKRLFVEHHGVVSCDFEEKQTIFLQCELKRASGERIGDLSAFSCEWAGKRKASKRKQEESPNMQDGNMTVNIHGSKIRKCRDDNRNQITAQNVSDRGSKLHSTQSDGKVRIGVSNAPLEDGSSKVQFQMSTRKKNFSEKP